MKYQYSHNRLLTHQIDGTIAVDVPSKEFLENMFKLHANVTMMMIGVTLKSPNDQFIKKTGRTIAESRMTAITCTLRRIKQHNTKHEYEFYTDDISLNNRKYLINFILTTVAESEEVRLVSSQLEHV